MPRLTPDSQKGETKVKAHRLSETGTTFYSVCLHYPSGKSRRELVRFWKQEDKENKKYLLCRQIKGKKFTDQERSFSQKPFSEKDLNQRAKAFEKTVRKNLLNYI